jgi:hypothetical protein
MTRLLLLLSSLIAAASGLAWIRSHWMTDLLSWTNSEGDALVISSSDGTLSLSKCAYHRQMFWAAPRSGVRYIVNSGHRSDWPVGLGAFGLLRSSYSGPIQFQQLYAIDSKSVSRSNFAGFGFQEGVIAGKTAVFIECRQIDIPFWAIMTVFSLPPIFKFRRTRALRHRLTNRRCLVCNYDLRASTDRCPECGHPIPAKPQPPATAPARSDTPA